MSCITTLRQRICFDRTYQSDAMNSLLEDPDLFLFKHCKRYIKKGGVSDVAVIDVSGRDMVIKRYNKRGIWHFIRNMPRKTRAMKSWCNAKLLLQLGISTAKPVAMIEQRIGPLNLHSYFVSEYVLGAPIHHYLTAPSVSVEQKMSIADKITKIFEKLSYNQIGHGDMKATNIIVHDGIPMLMDLDAMKQFSSASRYQKAMKKDINRFMRNWADNKELFSIFTEKLGRFI